MKSVLNNPLWQEFYNPIQLMTIDLFITDYGNKVLVYVCECCGKWSAVHTESMDLLIPVSEANRSSKEDAIKELHAQGFNVVGEYLNGNPYYYS